MYQKVPNFTEMKCTKVDKKGKENQQDMTGLEQITEIIILVQRINIIQLRKEVLLVNPEHFSPFKGFHHSHTCIALAPIMCMGT